MKTKWKHKEENKTGDAKAIIHHIPWVGWCSASSWAKTMNNPSQNSLKPLLLPLIAEHGVIWYEIPLWSVGPMSGRVLSQHLEIYSLGGGRVKSRVDLDAVQMLLSKIWSTSLLLWPVWPKTWSTAPCQLLSQTLQAQNSGFKAFSLLWQPAWASTASGSPHIIHGI